MSHKENNLIQSISPRKNLSNLFIWLVGASVLICTVVYAILGNGRFSEGFFLSGYDFFMDFFNSIRDAAQGSGVYSERGVIYPPMANLIFLFLSRFTSDVYNESSFFGRYNWVYFDSCLVLVLVTTVICCLALLVTIFYASKNGSDKGRLLFACAAIISTPLICMLERGNILLLCFIALTVYAITYNSESKVKREIGLICLAFAFSLKLYPAVFGWFLVSDKRYKDIVRCLIYGVAMFIIPSLFFGGPLFCLKYCIGNIFNFSTGTGNVITKVMTYFGFSSAFKSTVNILAYVWVVICGACFAISPFIRPDKPWKTWMIGLATILCIPSMTGIYNWAFFLIPMIMIFNNGKHERRELIGVWMMLLPFIHIPIRFTFHVVLSDIFVYLMSAVLSIFAVIDTGMDLGAYFREKKTQIQEKEA